MSISANTIVQSVPSVLNAGGTTTSENGVILSENALLPFGAPVAFQAASGTPNANVANFFGPQSLEAAMAAVYYSGFSLATTLPQTLYFSRYAASAIGAFLNGIPNAATIAQMQTIRPAAGTASIATGTGGLGTMTCTVAPASGAYAPGQLLTGTGVTAGTRIVAQLTGTTGGIGTYSVSISQTTASTAITGNYDLNVAIDGANLSAASLDLHAAASLSAGAAAIATALTLSGGQTCTYTSQTNSFLITSGTTGSTSSIGVATGAAAAPLGLGVGATVSQGSPVQTPQSAMTALTGYTTNWGGFATAFEPSNTDKMNFASWTSSTNDEFFYSCYDSDTTAATVNNNGTSFGPLLITAGYGGTILTGAAQGLTANLPAAAALPLAWAAALNYSETAGRKTLGLTINQNVQPTCTDTTSYKNLLSNGYNTYGQFATENGTTSNFYNDGHISGAYGWADAYVGASWFAGALQAAVLAGFLSVKIAPYNAAGYATIEAFCKDTIDQFETYGGIQTGVELSATQIATVNTQAGSAIDQALFSQGWYLKVFPATAAQRQARQPPSATIWFTDGGGIQSLNIGSVDVQ